VLLWTAAQRMVDHRSLFSKHWKIVNIRKYLQALAAGYQNPRKKMSESSAGRRISRANRGVSGAGTSPCGGVKENTFVPKKRCLVMAGFWCF